MAYDTPDLTGALFKNEKKERDNQPDYTGKLTIDGKEWRLAAWIKEAASGKKYMSIKASEPMTGGERTSAPPPRQDRSAPSARGAAKPAGNGGGNRAPILDDDIPFAAEVR